MVYRLYVLCNIIEYMYVMYEWGKIYNNILGGMF